MSLVDGLMRDNKNVMLNGVNLEVTREFGDCIASMENTMLNLFITGKAGTGKSTLIEYFRNTTKKKLVVLAPTGLAAINVRGQTIHSFFHFAPRFQDPGGVVRRSRSRMYRDLDCVIIDEISMVRADVFDAIDRFLRLNGKNKNLPFGGVQMIVVGDLYQLPPIVGQEESVFFRQLYDSPYFFSSDAFGSSNFEVIELTSVYRQKDQKFISILNHIREGVVSDVEIETLNERVIPSDVEKIRREYITLATTNSVVSGINDQELDRISSESKSFEAKVEGDFPIEERVLPVDMSLKLKVGAKVIFIKNDIEKRYVNGTTGNVCEISNEGIKVKIEEFGVERIVSVERSKWEQLKYEYDEDSGQIKQNVLGSLVQYPLKLAWAITIHKSQGMSFDRVNIDFSRSPFAHGQAYVALSRCRSLEGMIFTKKIYMNDIIVDPRIVEFSNKYLKV